MTTKQILIRYCKKTGIYPPFNPRKIRKAGYNVKAFLQNLALELEKSEDGNLTVQDFLKASKQL